MVCKNKIMMLPLVCGAFLTVQCGKPKEHSSTRMVEVTLPDSDEKLFLFAGQARWAPDRQCHYVVSNPTAGDTPASWLGANRCRGVSINSRAITSAALTAHLDVVAAELRSSVETFFAPAEDEVGGAQASARRTIERVVEQLKEWNIDSSSELIAAVLDLGNVLEIIFGDSRAFLDKQKGHFLKQLDKALQDAKIAASYPADRAGNSTFPAGETLPNKNAAALILAEAVKRAESADTQTFWRCDGHRLPVFEGCPEGETPADQPALDALAQEQAKLMSQPVVWLIKAQIQKTLQP